MKNHRGWLAALAIQLGVAGPAGAATIAVLDTGVTSSVPALNPFIVRPGFNAVDGNAFTEDFIGHGSYVAALAVRFSRFHARIYPVKVFPDRGFTLAPWVVSGLANANGRRDVRVINMSFGGGAFNPEIFQQLSYAVNHGKLVVMAAGNEGAPGPSHAAKAAQLLRNGGIAVGAVDNNGNIRTYSNRAGGNQSFYLVAPDDLFNTGLLGTSFAAPVVSGIASELFDRDPHLNAFQVGEILLRTAIDLGAPGTDPVYGRGLVNPGVVTTPVGATGVPVADRVSGPRASTSPESMKLSGASASAVIENSTLIGDALMLDEYGRRFRIDLAAGAGAATFDAVLNRFGEPFDRDSAAVEVEPAPGLRITLWHDRPAYAGTDDSSAAGWGPDHPRLEERSAMAVTGEADGRTRYAFGLNLDPRWLFEEHGSYPSGFRLADSGTPSFLGFTASASSARIARDLSDRVSVSLAGASADDRRRFGADSSATAVDVELAVSDDLRLRAGLGRLEENGSFLGGASNGAFSVDETDTLSARLGLDWDVGARGTAFGFYESGRSTVRESDASLLQAFSTVASETYGVGYIGRGVIRENDRMGIAASRPLRVVDGAVDVHVPVARDDAGTVLSERERISLAPDAAETDFELFYHVAVGSRLRWGVHFLRRDHPDHSSTRADENAVYGVIAGRF